MARKGDEAERAAAVAQWLDGALGRLMQLTDEAIAVVAAAEPPADVAEAEKRGRAIGVLARTARSVAALAAASPRKPRDPEEDGMSEDDRDITDDEERTVRAELQSRLDHLLGVAERKGFGATAADAGAARGAVAPAEGDAEAERGTGLAV
ncbi:hypothetical protein FM111_01450 [Brevundimonas diminuta 3F5N]|uniref:Uncharacterized protein n=1 Tax=Brevundimonas diminuta 3F5N TaxID=1255603 RepID=A0A1R4EXZ5_BREDI|nr:hypothetical protein [Brevundimonas diminuta]SJM48509.1 hypothetical protein FM111_01450 [Brevundimonas diminuta 3F5N]